MWLPQTGNDTDLGNNSKEVKRIFAPLTAKSVRRLDAGQKTILYKGFDKTNEIDPGERGQLQQRHRRKIETKLKNKVA